MLPRVCVYVYVCVCVYDIVYVCVCVCMQERDMASGTDLQTLYLANTWTTVKTNECCIFLPVALTIRWHED